MSKSWLKVISYLIVLIKRAYTLIKRVMAESQRTKQTNEEQVVVKPKTKGTPHSFKAGILFSSQRSKRLAMLLSPFSTRRVSADAPINLAAAAESLTASLILGAGGCAKFHGRSRIKAGDVFAYIRNDEDMSKCISSFAEIHVGNDAGVALLIDPVNRSKYMERMDRLRAKFIEKIKKEQQIKKKLLKPNKTSRQQPRASDKKRLVSKLEHVDVETQRVKSSAPKLSSVKKELAKTKRR